MLFDTQQRCYELRFTQCRLYKIRSRSDKQMPAALYSLLGKHTVICTTAYIPKCTMASLCNSEAETVYNLVSSCCASATVARSQFSSVFFSCIFLHFCTRVYVLFIEVVSNLGYVAAKCRLLWQRKQTERLLPDLNSRSDISLQRLSQTLKSTATVTGLGG